MDCDVQSDSQLYRGSQPHRHEPGKTCGANDFAMQACAHLSVQPIESIDRFMCVPRLRVIRSAGAHGKSSDESKFAAMIHANCDPSSWEPALALARRLGDEGRGGVLNLLAATLRAARVSGLMLREMFNVFERLATFLATISVSRHGIPPARNLHVRPRTKPGRCAAAPMNHCSSADGQTEIVDSSP